MFQVGGAGIFRCRHGAEAQDVAFPGWWVRGLIHRDDLPVIDVAHSHIRHVGGLIGRVYPGQILRIGSQIDLVRNGLTTRSPVQGHRAVQIGRSIRRTQLGWADGNVQEADLAQAVLGQQAAPVAVDRQLHVLGRNGAQIDRLGRICRFAGGLSQFDIAQGRPTAAICRVLDCNILGSVPDDALQCLIRIPDEHLIQLVDPVECVLDPRRLRTRHRTEPHVGLGRRVLVVGVKAGAVDRLLGPHRRVVRAGRRGCDILNRVGKRLDRESPNVAFVDHVVRGRADFIDSPVIGCTEWEPAGVVGGRLLSRVGQHPARIRRVGIAYIIENRTEIHIVRLGCLSRFPAQDHVRRHVDGPVRHAGRRGQAIAQPALHGVLDLVRR